MSTAADVVARFVDAYGRGDTDATRSLLGEDVVAYVTNAAGGVDEVVGRDAYAARLPSLEDAQLSIEIAQSVDVAPSQVMAMVKIEAERKGRSLRNFAAFLIRVHEGELVEIWMVEALPSYSDEFWS